MNLIWLLIQEHAPEAAEAAEHAPSVFALSTNVSFWTVVIFLILLGVLMKFAFPPILGYAEAREKRIQAQIDEAAAQRAEAEALLAQQREELSKARMEAQQLIAEGKVAAERVRTELLERSKAEQEQLVARAKADIVREREQAIESLRREAVDLALAAAGKLVAHKVDAEADRRLVTEYLKSVPAGTAGAA